MTCHSGGSIDLYIEPVLPKPHLIVIGKSVIGRALMRIAKASDYRITLIADDATPEVFPDADVLTTDFDVSKQAFNASTFLIVATQGDNDEKALAAALSVKCRYVSFNGDVKLSGTLAIMGGRVITPVANMLSKQFFEELEKEVAAK